MDGLRPLLASRVRRRHLVVFDMALGVLIGLVALERVALPPYGWLFGVALGLAAGLRRLWPLPTLAVVLALAAVGVQAGALINPWLVWAFVLYTVGLATSGLPAYLGLAAGLAGVAALVPLTHEPNLVGSVGLIGLSWLTMAAAWLLGLTVRERRTGAARVAEQQARLAVAEERVRIARELHDIVAHSLSLIAMRSGVAVHVAGERPGEAVKALEVIQETSRGALDEMRRMVGVLRSAGVGVGDPEDSPLTPVPGLVGLETLAGRAREAGVRVTINVDGGHDLPRGVESTVFRIVQESLTNVIKHAGDRVSCAVSVAVTPTEVLVEVIDDGKAGRVPSTQVGGHGLIGMRERALLQGGEFTAGPREQGGFRVAARLPYRR
ncbi:sensor histidine kinase [Nonomuraea turcica]|uniref:sensor histidine kinase n=1 Tax=Nonomuraea sp. G32 TaxID=3067274 RepID=UPI00273B2BE4|nr:sensor histidine kinase [Nonomuraea sp. G32]MDP4501374.1 sensor histidine kinase [Nonomuraea sp. G32]